MIRYCGLGLFLFRGSTLNRVNFFSQAFFTSVWWSESLTPNRHKVSPTLYGHSFCTRSRRWHYYIGVYPSCPWGARKGCVGYYNRCSMFWLHVMFLVNPLYALSKSIHIRNDNHTFTLLFLRHKFGFLAALTWFLLAICSLTLFMAHSGYPHVLNAARTLSSSISLSSSFVTIEFILSKNDLTTSTF